MIVSARISGNITGLDVEDVRVYIHHVPEAAFESLKEHGEYKKMPSGAEWVSLNNIHFCKESKEK